MDVAVADRLRARACCSMRVMPASPCPQYGRSRAPPAISRSRTTAMAFRGRGADPDAIGLTHEALAVARVLRRMGTPNEQLERLIDSRVGVLGLVERLELALLRVARGDSVGARDLRRTQAWQMVRRRRAESHRLDDTIAQRAAGCSRRELRAPARLFAATAVLEPKHPMLGALFESLVLLGTRRAPGGRGTRWTRVRRPTRSRRAARCYEFGAPRTVRVHGPGGLLGASRLHGRTFGRLVVPAAHGRRWRGGFRPLVSRSNRNRPHRSTTRRHCSRRRARDPCARTTRGSASSGGTRATPAASRSCRCARESSCACDCASRSRDQRQFVALSDDAAGGSRSGGPEPPHVGDARRHSPARRARRDPATRTPPHERGRWRYGSWDGGWWTPWEHKEIRDDRVLYFARAARGSGTLSMSRTSPARRPSACSSGRRRMWKRCTIRPCAVGATAGCSR